MGEPTVTDENGVVWTKGSYILPSGEGDTFGPGHPQKPPVIKDLLAREETGMTEETPANLPNPGPDTEPAPPAPTPEPPPEPPAPEPADETPPTPETEEEGYQRVFKEASERKE